MRWSSSRLGPLDLSDASRGHELDLPSSHQSRNASQWPTCAEKAWLLCQPEAEPTTEPQQMVAEKDFDYKPQIRYIFWFFTVHVNLLLLCCVREGVSGVVSITCDLSNSRHGSAVWNNSVLYWFHQSSSKGLPRMISLRSVLEVRNIKGESPLLLATCTCSAGKAQMAISTQNVDIPRGDSCNWYLRQLCIQYQRNNCDFHESSVCYVTLW